VEENKPFFVYLSVVYILNRLIGGEKKIYIYLSKYYRFKVEYNKEFDLHFERKGILSFKIRYSAYSGCTLYKIYSLSRNRPGGVTSRAPRLIICL